MFCVFKYVSPFSPTANIGDYVQSLAAAQFLPKVDYYVDRDQMSAFASRPEAFLMANAWYMKNPEDFPPPPNLRPFYISMHVGTPQMLTEKAVEHLREHEPIGCRDLATLELLRSRGVAAYYSGCLTLTLSQATASERSGIYIVDVSPEFRELIPRHIRDSATYVSHRSISRKLWKILITGRVSRPTSRSRNVFADAIGVCRELFSERMARLIPRVWTGARDIVALLHLVHARSLLDLYAGAELVITSRIHCGLPAVAFGTPVVMLGRRHLFDPSRLEAIERYVTFHADVGRAAGTEIDWSPEPVDVSAHARFLRQVCQEAVEQRDNPLRHRSLEEFCRASEWEVPLTLQEGHSARCVGLDQR